MPMLVLWCSSVFWKANGDPWTLCNSWGMLRTLVLKILYLFFAALSPTARLLHDTACRPHWTRQVALFYPIHPPPHEVESFGRLRDNHSLSMTEGAPPLQGIFRPAPDRIRIHVGQRRPPPLQGDHWAIAYSYPHSCWLKVPFPSPGGSSGHQLFVSAFMLAKGALLRHRGIIRPSPIRIHVHVG